MRDYPGKSVCVCGEINVCLLHASGPVLLLLLLLLVVICPSFPLLNPYPVSESAPEIVQLAERYQSKWVVGLDMAGDELKPLHANHVDAFCRAQELGLHITVHAGESGTASNVREAAQVLGAERIGHGYHVLDEREIYEFAKRKDLHFEVSTHCN